MKIIKSGIVSNSDVIKNYKAIRERSEELGKVFIFKNNQLDAVLFSISEYEKVSDILEEIETFDENALADVFEFVKRKKIELLIPTELSNT